MGELFIFVAGLIIGAILDNKYAPKIKVVEGKLTLEWSNKKP